MEQVARVNQCAAKRRSAFLQKMTELLREWLARRPPDRQGGMQEVVTAAKSMRKADRLKASMASIINSGIPPMSLRTRQKKLADYVEGDLRSFIKSDACQGPLKVWRDAKLNDFEKFSCKFKLKTTSQINPRKLRQMKVSPLYAYMFESEFSKGYHDDPLPTWN
jgi:hypothetical protein